MYKHSGLVIIQAIADEYSTQWMNDPQCSELSLGNGMLGTRLSTCTKLVLILEAICKIGRAYQTL